MATRGAAMLSAAHEAHVEPMRRFGYLLGMAFQIVDDALDFNGDEARVGKPVGNDLRQGLITLPTLCYIESQERPELLAALRTERLEVSAASALVDDIRRSGAVEQALEEARRMAATAETCLSGMPETPERAALYQAARYVVDRTL